MSLRENFTNSMNTIRATRQVSIYDFSEELCISRSTVQEILSGKANPTMEMVEHIAQQLQIDPLTLLSNNKKECPALFPALLHGLEFYDKLPSQAKAELTHHLLEIAALLECEP